MSKLFLIHGYGTTLELAFKPKDDISHGFRGFRHLLENQQAHLFVWAKERPLSDWDRYNPLTLLKTYDQDLLAIQERQLYEKLKQELEEVQPKAIVAFSLGGQVLLNYLKANSLPKSVKKVVTMQADITHSQLEETELTAHFETHPHLEWQNFHCWWDMALWFSSLKEGEPKIGLTGSSHPHIKNSFTPLTKIPAVHTSLAHSTTFADQLYAQLT